MNNPKKFEERLTCLRLELDHYKRKLSLPVMNGLKRNLPSYILIKRLSDQIEALEKKLKGT